MRTACALVALVLGVSGCVNDPDAGDPGPTPTHDCTPSYPDDSAFDCEANRLLLPPYPQRAPMPTEGWQCISHYGPSDGRGPIEGYRHQDGRLGIWWNLEPIREGGINLIQGTAYTDSGHVNVVALYEKQGFVAFPSAPAEAQGEIHLVMRNIQIDYQDTGGIWRKPDNLSLVVGDYQGEAWLVLRFDTANGTRYLDLMKYHYDDETRREYIASRQDIMTPEGRLYSDVFAYGIKYLDVMYERPATSVFQCSGYRPEV